MRLPEFLTELSPVRETLTALEQGENAMAKAVAEKNGQVCVETATGGLTLWERDYGLPVREGRRWRIAVPPSGPPWPGGAP